MFDGRKPDLYHDCIPHLATQELTNIMETKTLASMHDQGIPTGLWQIHERMLCKHPHFCKRTYPTGSLTPSRLDPRPAWPLLA